MSAAGPAWLLQKSMQRLLRCLQSQQLSQQNAEKTDNKSGLTNKKRRQFENSKQYTPYEHDICSYRQDSCSWGFHVDGVL